MSDEKTINLNTVTLKTVDTDAVRKLADILGLASLEALFCALITPAGRRHIQTHLNLNDEHMERLISECETLLGEDKAASFRMAEPHYRRLGLLLKGQGGDHGSTDID